MNFLKDNEIIEFWKENKIFQKSIENNINFPKFIFYDGPPFATGLPHYGHIVANTLKDIIPRYKSQNGFCVDRVFGWDTHGLPIEFEIEKILGIKTKKQVLEYGIGNYNEECRKIVLKYREEWKKTIDRLGRWVDMENDYKTMDPKFMESVWWVFSQLYKQNLIYKGVKVMPYSNGCTTPLSNFEATSNYKTVKDYSLTVKFKLIDIDYPNTFLMVWTTTPWTLPSNLAICVNPKLEYFILESNLDQNKYIIAKDCLLTYFKDSSKFKIVRMLLGKDLLDKKYIPLFNYYYKEYSEKGFKIINDSYVESTSGTGLVHVAPAFGKDDYRVCLENNIINKLIPPPCPLNENGYFTEKVEDFKNLYIKDAEDMIIEHLKTKNLVFTVRKEKHEYPYCWRSNTPLIYKIVESWFVNMDLIRDKLCKNNLETSWVPKNIRDNKFGKWIENSIDWCISRNRYWGTPIPIWISDDGEEIVCIDSIYKLEKLANLPTGSVKDIHSHHIDHIEIPSKMGKGNLKRIPEVFDCWFESGSMPYAQHGYPKTNKNLSDIFPADYIAEGTDQTRGWFYTLMVISTALFDKPAFKNVIVNGLVLAEDGEKMSKSKKNYPPVNDVFDQYGADAIRLYLIDGPVVKAGDLKFNKKDIEVIVKNVNILMYNMVTYLLQMIDLYQTKTKLAFIADDILKHKENITNPLDSWILQYTNNFIKEIHIDINNYELNRVVNKITNLIDKLSRWYIKLNKNKFNDNNKTSLNVLFYCIYHIIITIAPFTPFMSEKIYQKLKLYKMGEMSVHLIQMTKNIWIDDTELLEPMEHLYSIINASRKIRTKDLKRCKKKPINELVIIHNNKDYLNKIRQLEEYIIEEINVMNITYSSEETKYINYKLKLNPKLGKIFKQNLKKLNNYFDTLDSESINSIICNKKDIIIELDESYTIHYNDMIIVKENKNEYKEFISHIEDEFLVMMDKTYTENMETKYQSKLFTRFLQDYRKECNLIPSDNVDIYCLISEPDSIKDLDKILLLTENSIRNKINITNESIPNSFKTQYNLLNKQIDIYYQHNKK